MSENWGKEAADKLRIQGQRRAQEDAVLLAKQKLRLEQGPGLWNEVRQQIQAMCQSLNLEYGEDIASFVPTSHNELRVQLRVSGSGIREMFVGFMPTSALDALTWRFEGATSSRGNGGHCELGIDGDRVTFQQGRLSYTPESIAKEMLDGLLRG